jgi:LysM repeat protein
MMGYPLLVVLMCILVLGVWPDSVAQAQSETCPFADPIGAGQNGGVSRPEAVAPAPYAEEVGALKTEIDGLREWLELLEASLAASRRPRQLYAPPDMVAFAGEVIPLDRWDVRERLEREFYLALGDWGQVVLWLKRSARYFPYVEEELAKAQLPDDLKYVAVVESALLPTAYSRASALGIWQFTAATAGRYGLAMSPWWDERRDPQSSTRAALAYLKDLHARFGDWALALAGYNAGEGRVAQALQRQQVSSYYQLALPEETERYVLRVFAAKLILSDPSRYGFEVPTEQRYRPLEADTAGFEVRNRVLIMDLARAAGSFYREIRALNPEIVQEWLPRGHYLIRIPQGSGREFLANLAASEPRTTVSLAVSEPTSIRYRVKRGDTLLGIAQRFGVSVTALEALNKTVTKHRLVPGTILVIQPPGGRAGP